MAIGMSLSEDGPRLNRMARYLRKIKPFIPYILLIVFAALPTAGLSPNIVRLFFVTFIWVICSVAWNMLGGFAGQISFGFAVFYGLGAYAAALMINAGINPYLSFLGAAAVAVTLSVAISAPELSCAKGCLLAVSRPLLWSRS